MSSSLSLSPSLANPLSLTSSSALSRPSGLSGLSALSSSSPPLSSLHPSQLSTLSARPTGGGGSVSGGGLLGSLSGLSGLPVNGLFPSVLSPHSFSPDMQLLLSSQSSSAGGGGSAGGKSVGTRVSCLTPTPTRIRCPPA